MPHLGFINCQVAGHQRVAMTLITVSDRVNANGRARRWNNGFEKLHISRGVAGVTPSLQRPGREHRNASIRLKIFSHVPRQNSRACNFLSCSDTPPHERDTALHDVHFVRWKLAGGLAYGNQCSRSAWPRGCGDCRYPEESERASFYCPFDNKLPAARD